MRTIISRSLTSLNVKSPRTLQVRRTSDQTVRHDDKSRRKVQNVPADSWAVGNALPGLPFSVHHNNLTQQGIHQIQNLVLDEMARDRVSLSCAIVLPLRVLGGAGSPVRTIAIGVPRH
jgi:kynurenine formamidase